MIDTNSLPQITSAHAHLKMAGGAAEAEALLKNKNSKDSPELREAFDDFVGQSFFGQLLRQMRETVDKPAYFHGGMGEDVFQGQLDQLLVERISDASAETFSQPMYDQFMLSRS